MTKTPGQKAAATRKARAAQAQAAREALPSSTLLVRCGDEYRAATRIEVLEAAAVYFDDQTRGLSIVEPREAVQPMRNVCAAFQHERFCVIYIDTRHRVLKVEALFEGTIDGCAVYPREVVRRALELNAAGIILGHNHPSGDPAPSEADRAITIRVAKALALVDIRLLDHLVVTPKSYTSLAEKGWL